MLSKKKLIAGVATLALALGLVTATATSASAHHNTITATIGCTTDFKHEISWSVKNSEDNKSEKITASNRGAVKVDDVIEAGKTRIFTETVTGPVDLTLTLSAIWSNGVKNTNSGSVVKSDFGNCDPKVLTVTLCHATPPDTAAAGWEPVVLNDNAVVSSDHNSLHSKDIIPSFTYWVNVAGEWKSMLFGGKNLGTVFSGFTGEQILAAGCLPTVSPVAPTFTPAVCTAPGQAGQGEYTIPSTPGVQYSIRLGGTGDFADVAAGSVKVPIGTFIEVKAKGVPSWVSLTGTMEWSHTFLSPGDCIVTSSPVAPAASEIKECGTYGKLILPTTLGVVYTRTVGDGKQGAWTVVATPAAGYKFIGAQTVTYNGNLGKFTTCVTPTVPTFVDAKCTGPGTSSDGSYTIPLTPGVAYEVKIGDDPWVPAKEGTFPVTVFPSTVQVRASAESADYTLKDYTGPWSHTFESAGECDVTSAPVAPSAKVITGCGVEGSVKFASTTGVVYTLTAGNGTSGKWEATATPADGYVFTGDQVVTYSGDLGKYTDCATPKEVTFSNSVCELDGPKSGSYTIPETKGVQYSVDEGDGFIDRDAGTYEVEDGDVVTVQAHALPNYTLVGDTEWTHTFTILGECDLTTLGFAVPTFSSTPITCTAAGSFTVGAAINGEFVQWRIEGDDTPLSFGTHTVTTTQNITLVATSVDPIEHGLATLDSQPWVNPPPLSFQAPVKALCGDLKTLALTGTSLSLLGIGLAAGLMMLGIGGVFLSRRRAASK